MIDVEEQSIQKELNSFPQLNGPLGAEASDGPAT
jgi:hypothetical protein